MAELCQTFQKGGYILDGGYVLDPVSAKECWGHMADRPAAHVHVYDSGDQVCWDSFYQPVYPGPKYGSAHACFPRAHPLTTQQPNLVVIIQNFLSLFVKSAAPPIKDLAMNKNVKPGQEIVADFYTEVFFSDGSTAQAAKGARFTVDSETSVHSVFGRYRYLWKPFRCPFKNQRCKIVTPQAGIWVRGTEFVVEVDAQTTNVWVLHGSLEVSDPGGNKTVPVAANQYVTVRNNGVVSDPKGFDPQRLSHWWQIGTEDLPYLPLLLAGTSLIVLVLLLGRLASALKRRQMAASGRVGKALPLLGGVAVVGAAALPWISSWSALPGFGIVRTFQFLDFPFGLLSAGMGAESAARAGAALLGLVGVLLVFVPGASAGRRICGLLAALVACAYATLIGVGTVFGGLGPGAGIVLALVGGLLLATSRATRGSRPVATA